MQTYIHAQPYIPQPYKHADIAYIQTCKHTYIHTRIKTYEVHASIAFIAYIQTHNHMGIIILYDNAQYHHDNYQGNMH